jgi:hypothetical protein
MWYVFPHFLYIFACIFQEFQAHKQQLSRSSDVFHTMFYGGLPEQDIVRVTDVTPAAFQALLT